MDIEDWALESGASGGVTGRVELPGVEGGLVLKFDARSAMPSPAQVEAVQAFVAAWPALREALSTALHAYASASAILQPGVAPAPASAAEAWSAVWLNEMHVPAQLAKGSRLVRLEGECDWAHERGLEIGVRNATELLYVGPNEGKGLREPALASPWNYADPAVRDAALAGTPVDEEAFDDARAASMAESTSRRPWWKPW